MAVKTFPTFGGKPGPATITFPLIAPDSGSAGQEPFRFASGGGIHGTASGGVALSVAAGDAVAVDAQANVNLPQKLSVQKLAMLAGGVRSPDANFDALTVTGGASVAGDLGIGGSAQITGDLTARKITASSALTAASLSTPGQISGATLSITGAATLGSLTVQGTFKASAIESDGPLYFPGSDPSTPGVALGSQTGTGLFAVADTLGLTVAGHTVVSFATNTGRRADFAAGITATAATFSDLVTANALTVSGVSTLQKITGTTLTLTGAAGVGGDLDVGGGLHVHGDLTVDGLARLANLRIDMLSTDHNLSVGQDASVAGKLSVQGATTLQGALSAQSTLSVGGQATLQGVSGTRFDLGSIFQLGGNDTYPAVLKVPVPNQPTTIDYSFVLGSGGFLSMSANLYVGGGAQVRNAVTLQSGLSGQGASFAGSVAAQALSATTSVIGSSRFSTCSGTPNGQVVGSVGDQVIDLQSGLSYLKLSGSSTNNGWVAVTTSASSLSYPLQAPATSATTGPSFSFATSGGDGLGSTQAGTIYLSTGHAQALTIDGSQNVVLAAALSGPSATFQALSATGDLNVGGNGIFSQGVTAQTATLGGLLTAGSATISGSFTAGPSQLASAQVSGNASVGGNLAVFGTISAVGDVQSNARVVAAAAVLAGARISAGSGNPNGSVQGTIGDLFIETDTAALWQKSTSSSTSGWLKVGGGGVGNFPLAAPLSANLAAPSYGFAGSQMGLTDQGANVLVGVTNGTIGWQLDQNQAFSLTGSLTVAGSSQVAALSASGPLTSASVSTGSLTATGASSLQGLSAKAISAQSLTTTTGSVQSAQDVVAAGSVSGTLVVSNGSTWRAGSGLPANSIGAAGDFASITSGSSPFAVRTSSSWRYVALVGDPAPTAFPLLAPADSASAPSYATAQSANTGMYFPGPNRLAWSTNGLSAGNIDANQNWSLVGNLSALVATFTGLTVNGPSNLTDNVTVGGTLQVAKAATFTSSITAASANISGALTSGSATINGALNTQTLTTTGDVSIGGNLTVQGTTTQAGIQRAGFYQTSDGTVSSPAYSFTNETGLGLWRPAAGTLAVAAGGANILSLTSALATFSGSVRIGGTNAGLVSPGGNSIALQTGGTAALTIGSGQTASFSSTVGAAQGSPTQVAYNLANNSTYGLYGDTTSGSLRPAVSSGGVGIATWFKGKAANNYAVYGMTLGDPNNPNPDVNSGQGVIFGSSTPPNGQVSGTAGSLYCHWAGGGTTPSLYINEVQAPGSSNTAWARVITSTTVPPPVYPLVGPAGSASAPTFQAASGNGLYSGTDGLGRAMLGLAQGGASVGRLATFTNNSLPVWIFGLGDAASTSVSGGLVASAQLPSTGAPAGLPGMVYQYLGGGAAQSLWVNESTTTTPSWAKVLTTSSPVQATFPLLANPDGSLTAPAYAWSSEAGLGWFRSAAATMVATAAGAALATLTTNLLTLPGALRVGGTNAGLTSPGTNQLALQTAGTTALSLAASGVATFAFQAVHSAGTVTAPGVAVGGSNTGLYVGSDFYGTPFLGLSQGGKPTLFAQTATGSQGPLVYSFALGDPSSAATFGGIKASTVTPVGNIGAAPSQLYQYIGGGAAQSLWVYEGTSAGNSTWAKVLTTSSTITPSFPIVGPAGSAAAPTFAVSSANTGMFSVNLGSTIPTTASFAQGGRVIGNFYGYTTAGSGAATPLSVLLLGDGTTTNVGIISMGAITPNGNVGGYGGSLHVFPNQGAGKSLWLNEGTGSNSNTWGTVYSTLTPQLAGGPGTAAAPYYAFAGNLGTGLWAGTDAFSTNVLNMTVAGVNVGILKQIPTNSLPLFAFALGNVASSTVNGGIIASGQAPTGIGAFPSQIYQDTRGGSGCLYVCEATANSSTGWAKILTTSSTVSPTFPILAPSGSAAAPSYSFSASSSSGLFYTVDAGASNAPAPAISTAGKVTSYFTQNTVNSLPVYNLCMGDPTVNASPYNGALRSSQQAANGNIIGAPGQIAINPSGGAGTTVAVKETGVGTSTGWSFVLTQGTPQISGGNGTLAAPLYSFASAKSTGFYYGDMMYAAANGVQALGIGTAFGGVAGYNGVTFGAGNTAGIPYLFGVPSSAANAGNPNTNAVPAYQGAVMINAAGAAGNQLWIHEPTSSSSGWVRILTESTAPSFSRLLQTSAPTTVSGQALVWADTLSQLRVSIFGVNASSTPVIKQEIVGTPYGATQTITAANSGSTIVLNSGSQFTLTLPAGSSTNDLVYRFQTETAPGVVIKANSGQTIFYGNQQTAAAGTITTSAAGSSAELYLRAGATAWITRYSMGSWTAA